MKPKPKDATIRNVKASKSRDDKLAARVKVLEVEVKRLAKVVKTHAKMFDEGKWA